jgi:cellulose biosynthesis protein BcsQ
MKTDVRTIERRFRPNGRNWPLIWAFLIACGGATKTSTATALATILGFRGYKLVIFDLDANMSASKILGWDKTALEGRKSAFDLITGTATLDEVALPARYRIDEGYSDDAFENIPNVRIVPGSVLLAEADTVIAQDADHNDWFMNLLHNYEGDDELFLVDFPASYGKMVYSAARMLDDDDSVIPSFRADPKDVDMVPELIAELENIREKNKHKRVVPGRPTIKHIVLTSTPTATYTEATARRAVARAEALYGEVLLPYVRYSADAKKVYEDKCPIEVLLPKSYPAEDYRKVATALGFPERPEA